MTITLTLQGVLLTILAVLGMALLIYLIVFVANSIKTMKHTNQILEDAKVISGIAADKAKKLDGMIDGLDETVETIVDTLKGNKNIVSAATNVVNAVSNLAGMATKSEKKKEKKDNKDK